MEADGGRTENAIYNVVAAKWRPVEADGGQVEAAQDMQIPIVRHCEKTTVQDQKCQHRKSVSRKFGAIGSCQVNHSLQKKDTSCVIQKRIISKETL